MYRLIVIRMSSDCQDRHTTLLIQGHTHTCIYAHIIIMYETEEQHL